jgi:hypothetical protein
MCVSVQSTIHENEYDLERGGGPDATPLLWNLCAGALSSMYENECDLESGIGTDATPFPLRISVPMHCSRLTRMNITLTAK